MVKDLISAILLNQISVVQLHLLMEDTAQYADFLSYKWHRPLWQLCDIAELIAFFSCLDVNSGIPPVHHRWSSSGFTFLLSFFVSHLIKSPTLAILHFLSGRGQMIADSK